MATVASGGIGLAALVLAPTASSALIGRVVVGCCPLILEELLSVRVGSGVGPDTSRHLDRPAECPRDIAAERCGLVGTVRPFVAGEHDLAHVAAPLDLIGWAEPRHQTAMRIELRAHQQALPEALEVRLLVATDDFEEADTVDAERAKRGEPAKREATEGRMVALC
jgi:hypothetical protein